MGLKEYKCILDRRLGLLDDIPGCSLRRPSVAAVRQQDRDTNGLIDVLLDHVVDASTSDHSSSSNSSSRSDPCRRRATEGKLFKKMAYGDKQDLLYA